MAFHPVNLNLKRQQLQLLMVKLMVNSFGRIVLPKEERKDHKGSGDERDHEGVPRRTGCADEIVALAISSLSSDFSIFLFKKGKQCK